MVGRGIEAFRDGQDPFAKVPREGHAGRRSEGFQDHDEKPPLLVVSREIAVDPLVQLLRRLFLVLLLQVAHGERFVFRLQAEVFLGNEKGILFQFRLQDLPAQPALDLFQVFQVGVQVLVVFVEPLLVVHPVLDVTDISFREIGPEPAGEVVGVPLGGGQVFRFNYDRQVADAADTLREPMYVVDAPVAFGEQFDEVGFQLKPGGEMDGKRGGKQREQQDLCRMAADEGDVPVQQAV